ncbi:Polyprenyl synthetase-domain-containing protein [Armillaria fumosa]|nr:Polyprenyl synthetase-domain-containing protein [Armillaria fumosa]
MCQGGKLNCGMSVITAEIIKGTPLTYNEHPKAAVLGWVLSWCAFFLISDDMMNSSMTRRGQPCWYRVPKVGQIAINDSFMLEAAIYYLLKKHFRGESYYEADVTSICSTLTLIIRDQPRFNGATFSSTVTSKTAASDLMRNTEEKLRQTRPRLA